MAEKVIQGRTVRYERLPGDQAVRLLLRVLKVLGPAGGLLGSVFGSEGANADTAASAGAFLAAMDDKAVYGIIEEVVAACRIDGTQATIGVMDLDEILAVAQFALRAEFSGFFSDAGAAVLLLLQRQAAVPASG